MVRKAAVCMLCMACPVGRQPLPQGPHLLASWVTPSTRRCRLALGLWDPHILRLLLAAGMPVPHTFRGQTALDYLLQGNSGRGLSYLSCYLCPPSQQPLQVRLHCSLHAF